MTLPLFSMRVRLDAMARVNLNLLDSGGGWRSLRAHALACHVCYNRRNARYFRFRESSGWRYWSYNPEITTYTPEQAREINRQEAGGTSFVRRFLNQ